MRCWELRSFGLDGLAQAERPDISPGAGQVSIRVHAASLNYRDWLMVQGRYNPKQPLPLIPLSDGAGEVTAVGDGVTRCKPGDRVAAIFSQRWLAGAPSLDKIRSAMGGPLDGMLWEQRVLSQEGVVRIPDHLSFGEAATLPCAALTAWNALRETGSIGPADTVLVQGTGGVSIFALQFAKMAGARVIATSSSDQKLTRARALGADETINYQTTPEWDRAAKALTGGIGVDHIIEVGGAGTFARSLRAARIGGTISVIGQLGGNTTETNLIPILMQSLRVQGITVGNRDMFEAMNRAMAHHAMRPVIDRVFAFSDVPQAFEHLAKGAHFGKVVISL